MEVVLIVGMHRSGTSAIARAVNIMGFDIGSNLMEPTDDNLKGYWEDWDVVSFNEALLKADGVSWDTPSVLNGGNQTDVSNKTNEELRSLYLKKFSKQSHIAIKDPRMSLLLPDWLRFLKSQNTSTKLILCLRPL